MELIRYEQAKKALAELVEVDEVREIMDRAVAVQAYARMAEDRELETRGAEVRLRAQRRLGQLMDDMPKATNRHKTPSGLKNNPVETLADKGINKNLAHACRKAASLDDEDFEAVLDEYRDKSEPVTVASLLRKPHVHHSNGNQEWYTPPEYIEAARSVMGGIDVDPASNDAAQEYINAGRYFTAENSGLRKQWKGRVWLNPPYSKELIPSFIAKLITEYDAQRLEQAIVLVNNATDTQWAHDLFSIAERVCFVLGRIKFLGADLRPANTPLQGQMFLYTGRRAKRFTDVFSKFGTCMQS